MADRLTLLRQEVQHAIEGDIPDAGLCAEAVEWLFQCDRRAPFAMAIGRLTGISIDDQSAPAVWRHALEIQHRWSGRLREAVTMRAAATEAVVRAREIEAPSAEMAAPSLRPYLDRDLLTGLFNRPFYERRLPDELGQADRTGQPVSLVLLELGGIEELERSLTRSDYDDLLRTIGEQIRFHFRPADLPCRTGDFQFSVILPATPANVAHAMADSFVEVTGHRHQGQPLT
ncbi:MAG: diguanylate cyclase, partial [Chloroflexi bacterium]|nr:diguanylate cyclase [Chloroflexota bacterium]